MSTDAIIPSLPRSFLSSFGIALQESITREMDYIQEELQTADELRDQIYKSTRVIFRNLAKLQFNISIGNMDGIEAEIGSMSAMVEDTLTMIGGGPTQREANLNRAIESLTEVKLQRLFFLTGKLAPQSEVQPCNDEEYMSASLGFAQHLARYCVGRACEADTRSIHICRTIVSELMEKMLEFDFRNGPLRRKYDGLKYAMRKLENITYEMSLLESDEPSHKRAKVDNSDGSSGCLDGTTYDEIRGRMEAHDKLREELIKGCRDVQKLSKQAIFSVHRGKLEDAQAQLDKAEAASKRMHEIVEEESTLRHGSYSNCLEEWAEAALTLTWARGGGISSMASMAHMGIKTNEYLGALSDFTGEVGRMAVVAASARDLDQVRNIHNCVIIIAAAFQQINASGKFTKKIDAVNMTMKKLEDVVYELTMVMRGGRSSREKAVDEAAGDKDREE